VSNALPVLIGQEVISMFDELFPGTIDQLNKLTIIRYDRPVPYSQQDDSLKENDHRCDQNLRQR